MVQQCPLAYLQPVYTVTRPDEVRTYSPENATLLLAVLGHVRPLDNCLQTIGTPLWQRELVKILL